MIRVRFIGPSAKRHVEFPDGRAYIVRVGDEIDVEDEIGEAMVAGAGYPRMWELASSPKPRPAVESEPEAERSEERPTPRGRRGKREE